MKRIKKFMKKVKKDSNPVEKYEELFNHYMSKGMEEEAIPILEKYLEIRNDYPEGECHLGILYFNKGDLEKAAQRFINALKINPEMKDANFNLGFINKLLKRYNEALMFFKIVIDKDPADVEVLFNTAECCKEIGKNSDALFFYQNVLKLNPEHIEAKKGLEEVKKFVSEKEVTGRENKLNILFVQEFPCIRNYKMAKALKSKGHKVSLAYTRGKLSQVYKNLDDDVYYELIPLKDFRQLWDISQFYDIVHSHNEPDTLTVNSLASDCPVIHDTHDLLTLRESNNPNLKYFEGIANRGADGRIYVSNYQLREANYLYGIDVDNSLVFCNYVSSDDIPSKFKPKLSEKDGKIHIVYEGSLGVGSSHRNFISIFKELAGKGFHIHIYSANYMIEYEKELINNPYIHYNKPISPKNLIYEISQYDFGIIPLVSSKESERHVNSALPHKLFEYQAAGLPVIASDLEEIRNYLRKTNVGILYKNINDISNSIEKLKKIKVKNKVSTFEGEINKLIRFYRKIIDKKNNSRKIIYEERRREHLKKVYSYVYRGITNDFYNGKNVDPLSNKLAVERIDKIISMIEGDVLEVGCNGGIIPILAGRKKHNCVGIDPVVEVINAAKFELLKETKDVQERVKFDVAWAEDMPFDDNKFDTVVLGEVLEHVMDLDMTLKQVKRVLKPKGKLIATVPMGDTKVPTHLRVFFPETFKSIMNRYFTSTQTVNNGKYFIWYVGRNLS